MFKINLSQELKRIRRNENKRKWWTLRYKGFYVICPNPDCGVALYLPAEKDYLQDKIYSCSICGRVFNVLDVLDEDIDLYGDNWKRVKHWFRFWGWKKVEVYKPRNPLTGVKTGVYKSRSPLTRTS